ncbi:MAG: nitroreductase family protein [Acidimicrobiales bacterium]|jgi:nitroreductase
MKVGTDEGAGGPPFFDVVMAQRACRQFGDRYVDDTMVELCLTAATHAPSAENLQPWVFLVVREQDQRAAIAELTRGVWRQMGRPASEGRLTPGLMADVDAGAETGMAGAPVLVVVCGDSSVAHRSTLPASVFPATQNLLLAAGALGLGSAMTTLATLEVDDLRDILDLPDHVHPMAVVPLGWPARPLGPPRRQPVSERAHRDRYGTGWA